MHPILKANLKQIGEILLTDDNEIDVPTKVRLLAEGTTSKGPQGKWSPTGQRLKRSNSSSPDGYFNGGRSGDLTFKIIPWDTKFNPLVLVGLLKLIEQQGALGAKPQLGYGLIKLKLPTELDFSVDEFVADIKLANSVSNPSMDLPTLCNMFFVEVTPNQIVQEPSGNSVQNTLNLKYDLRKAFRPPTSLSTNDLTSLQHLICGKVQGNNRTASKIAISSLVNGKLRIWGWVPERLVYEEHQISGVTRENVMSVIYNTITSFGTITKWREFNNVGRDNFKKYTSPTEFLKSLL